MSFRLVLNFYIAEQSQRYAAKTEAKRGQATGGVHQSKPVRLKSREKLQGSTPDSDMLMRLKARQRPPYRRCTPVKATDMTEEQTCMSDSSVMYTCSQLGLRSSGSPYSCPA